MHHIQRCHDLIDVRLEFIRIQSRQYVAGFQRLPFDCGNLGDTSTDLE